MLRSRRWSLVVALLVGCSAANARYGESGVGSGSSDGTRGTSSGVDSSGSSEGVGAQCQLHADDFIELEIRQADGSIVAPDCSPGNEDWWSPLGRVQYPGEGIEILPCGGGGGGGGGGCMECSDEAIVLDFLGTVETASNPINCGDAIAWAGRDDEGNCDWRGVVLFSGQTPAFVATNDREPPPLLGFRPGLASDELCGGTCEGGAGPGRHALVFVNEAVTPQISPVNLDVDLSSSGAPPSPYEIDARTASITEDCQEQVSWTARLR